MPESTVLVATVAVAAPLATPLSYLVPSELVARVVPGGRVVVPLGRRNVAGCVLALAAGGAEGLKAIREADAEPLFPAAMLPFLLRAAEYYRYPPGEAIRSVVPAGLGSVEVRTGTREERFFTATPGGDWPRGEKQCAVLALLRAQGPLAGDEVRRQFPDCSDSLRRLRDGGWLEESRVTRWRDPFLACPAVADTPPLLGDEQAAAVAAITAKLATEDFAPFLLHGVTGSGKTEVYLHTIAAALDRGRDALILVPEIALTPQLVARFRARFAARANEIAVLHSGLGDGERLDAWRRITKGQVHIVIGARSAVFAPLPNLGIVVVDEEHDGSYKQGEGFRYHARDLALLRAQMCGATVVLGSATPAVTTHQRAMTGSTGYLPLTSRVLGRPLPQVEIVDLRGRQLTGALDPCLTTAIGEELAGGGQTLLLLNRRGFAPSLLCSDCGSGFHCPNCDIALTFHRGIRRLRCHYCDHAAAVPHLCPTCGGERIEPLGSGTERLEDELAELFPAARIARMDRDTTGRKGAHQSLIDRMTAGEIDILVGTQMIAKGHDFPGVTLVGVLRADLALNLPDYRSAERTFALLSQVAGRAGRGERAGRVLIQSYAPDHYAVTSAATHDYRTFFEREIVFRRELGYPPFGFLVNLVVAGNDGAKVAEAARRFADFARTLAPADIEVLGPAPCPLARLRGKSREQILFKAQQRPFMQRLLDRLAKSRLTLPAGVQLTIDVDPLDML